jgi:hypothetical protein
MQCSSDLADKYSSEASKAEVDIIDSDNYDFTLSSSSRPQPEQSPPPEINQSETEKDYVVQSNSTTDDPSASSQSLFTSGSKDYNIDDIAPSTSTPLGINEILPDKPISSSSPSSSSSSSSNSSDSDDKIHTTSQKRVIQVYARPR